MGGIANGIAYHGGFVPYCATFLTFSDYMRGSVRLAALSGSTSSTSGPTTRSGWARTARPTSRSSTTPRSARSRTCGSSAPATPTRRRPPGRWRSHAADGPVALSLTRQKLPTLPGTATRRATGSPGAATSCASRPAGPSAIDLILIATGSELQLAVGRRGAARPPKASATRVVSLPCWELFELQDRGIPRDGPAAGVRKRVERGGRRVPRLGTLGRRRGRDRRASITSARQRPAATIFEHFGFTADRVADLGRRVVRDGLRGRIPTLDPGHQPAGRGGCGGPALGARRRRRSAAEERRCGSRSPPITPGRRSSTSSSADWPRRTRPRARRPRRRRRRTRTTTTPTSPQRLGPRRPRRRGRARASSSAARASGRPSRRTRSAASARRSATTRTPPTRASSTMT